MVTTGEQAVKKQRKRDSKTLFSTKSVKGAVRLRPYRPADLEALAVLFYAAVHSVGQASKGVQICYSISKPDGEE